MRNQFFPPWLLFLIGLTSSSPCLIQSGYAQLGLLDGFCPIRCAGDQMSALSGCMLHCLEMNTRQLTLPFVLSFSILHFLAHAMRAALSICGNPNYYTQINFRWLNHTEKNKNYPIFYTDFVLNTKTD